MARGLGFVTPCPNKQGKNAYFSKVSDAPGTACDAVNHYGWSLWKNEDLLADLVDFFCSGSAVQRSLWARLEKRVPVSEAEKKRRRTEAANDVTPLSVVDLVLLLKIPRRRYYCGRFACDIARTSAHSTSTRFVDFCARYVPMLRPLFSSGKGAATVTYRKIPRRRGIPQYYATVNTAAPRYSSIWSPVYQYLT